MQRAAPYACQCVRRLFAGRLDLADGFARRCVGFAVVIVCALAGSGWTTEVTPGVAAPAKPRATAKPKAPPAAPTSTASPAGTQTATADSAAPVGPKEPAANPSLQFQLPSSPQPRPPAQRVPKVTSGAVALAATLEGDASFTSLVLTLTRAAKFATFTLADPHRVIVDLQDVDFKVPPVAGAAGRGLIKAFRYGLLAPGKSRIVIDLAGPVRIEKADIVALRGAETVQLRVSLAPASREEFLAAAIGASASAPTSAPPAQASQVAISPDATKPRKGGKPVIVLDPGHGGIDAGTLGSANTAEKDVVLRFAKLLREKLRATGRFEVHMTRDIDVFVKLDERVRVARSLGCDLFISLHTDSVPAQYAHLNVRGATIYTMSAQDGDARAQKLAEKENLSDVIAGVENLQDEEPEVAGILTDLMRRETTNSSAAFTGTLMDYMKKSTGLSREPHRNAAFKVLRAPDMPSVLVELGFLSNREDEKLLVSAAWQDQVSSAIGRAVETYFAKRVARTPY